MEEHSLFGPLVIQFDQKTARKSTLVWPDGMMVSPDDPKWWLGVCRIPEFAGFAVGELDDGEVSRWSRVLENLETGSPRIVLSPIGALDSYNEILMNMYIRGFETLGFKQVGMYRGSVARGEMDRFVVAMMHRGEHAMAVIESGPLAHIELFRLFDNGTMVSVGSGTDEFHQCLDVLAPEDADDLIREIYGTACEENLRVGYFMLHNIAKLHEDLNRRCRGRRANPILPERFGEWYEEKYRRDREARFEQVRANLSKAKALAEEYEAASDSELAVMFLKAPREKVREVRRFLRRRGMFPLELRPLHQHEETLIKDRGLENAWKRFLAQEGVNCQKIKEMALASRKAKWSDTVGVEECMELRNVRVDTKVFCDGMVVLEFDYDWHVQSWYTLFHDHVYRLRADREVEVVV